MKTIFTLLLVVGFTTLTNAAYCSASDVFTIDEVKVNTELSGLSDLENYVENHPSTDLVSLKASNTMPEVVNKLNPLQSSDLAATNATFGGHFISFLAGFCCGVPGIAIVFFASQKDFELTQTAIIAGLIAFVIAIIYFIIVVSSPAFNY